LNMAVLEEDNVKETSGGGGVVPGEEQVVMRMRPQQEQLG